MKVKKLTKGNSKTYKLAFDSLDLIQFHYDDSYESKNVIKTNSSHLIGFNDF